MGQERRFSAKHFFAAVSSFLVLVACLTAIGTELESKSSAASVGSSPGYWLIASDGGVYAFSTANFGSMRGHPLNRPIVGGAATSDGLGYWMVASDGGVFTFGNAPFYGSMGATRLSQPVIGMAMDPATGGYWLVAADGGVFSFDAPFYGSTGAIHLNQQVVGMAATPTGHGYWLVAADGGIFTFGDARYYGSMGAVRLNQPVVGMAQDPGTGGYWLAAADGGIFSFNAPFYGSTGAIHLNKPIRAMASTGDGGGYWLVASDGGIFTFGDAPYLGSTGSHPGPVPIVSIAATAHGYPFPPGGTGYDVDFAQCNASLPPAKQVQIVQMTGAIDGYPNPCYVSEAAWAGPSETSYIFMDGLPNPPPSTAMTGPAGTCSPGNVNCESFNYGYFWARHWVSQSEGEGVSPTLWWLDVETDGVWSSNQASNAQVIAGAVAGLRSTGVEPGIYSTAYQWGSVTGNQVNFPGITLWEAGAGQLSGGSNSAQSFCAGTAGPNYAPFAGGNIVLVQWGYFYSYAGYNYDQDYACS